MALERKPVSQLINVHQVYGDKDVINFLKNTGKDYVEGLFYNAKRYGKSGFRFQDVEYELIRNRDFSFTIRENPDKQITTESLA